MKLASASSIISAAFLCSCSTDTGINTEALFEARCGVCHSTSIPKGARKTKPQWNESVERMMAKGVILSPEEKRALVNYLAEKYKP